MVKKSTSKQAATPKVVSKEAEQLQKLQTELRESRKEVRTLKSQVSTEKKARATEKKEFEREKKTFEDKLKEFEDKKRQDIEVAIIQERAEQMNMRMSLKEQWEELVPRFARTVDQAMENYLAMLKWHEDFTETVESVTQFENDPHLKGLKDSAGKMKEEFKKSLKIVNQTSSVCKTVLELAATGQPVCKTCLVKYEREPVNVDHDHLPDCLPTACQICCYKFSEIPGQVPRVLRCGHTLCERCIDSIKVGENFTCPYDRKEVIIPLGKAFLLPKNFTVLEIIKTMPVLVDE